MSEKRFIASIFIEGIILITLALCTLIIPKLTELSFGIMLSITLIFYGLYKIIHSIVYKNYGLQPLLGILLGTWITVTGILLLFVPKINLLWLVALLGVYFILESIASVAFSAQIKNMYNFWGCKLFSAGVLFIIGTLIILGLPVMSFWAVVTLSGLGFLVKGASKISLYMINKNNYV